MIKIKDNFLDRNIFQNIQQLYLSNQIPWTYGEVVFDHELESEVSRLDNYQLSHLLYSYDQPTSNLFQHIVPSTSLPPSSFLDSFDKLISLVYKLPQR